jgi:hypothetical protein
MLAPSSLFCAFLMAPAAAGQDQPVPAASVEAEVSFTGLSRQPRPWYLKPDGPIAEACACTGSDGAGRPVGVSSVFPSGTREVALYFRVQERARESRAQTSLWHNGTQVRRETFGVPGRRFWVWDVEPKNSRTFAPGLYTFALAIGGQLLAALDFVITSTPQVDPAAVQEPEYTDVPPPPRLLAISEQGTDEAAGPVAVVVVRKPIGGPSDGEVQPGDEGSDAADGTVGQEPGTETRPAEGEPAVGDNAATATPPTDVGSKQTVIEGLVKSAQSQAPSPPAKPATQQNTAATAVSAVGGLLGDLIGEATGIKTVVDLVVGLFTTKPRQPSQFTVQKPQTGERLAYRMLQSHRLDDALGGRRAATHAVAMASDSQDFGRGVLLLPLELRPDESGILALLIINNVSVFLNDAPVAAASGFEFRFRGGILSAVPVRIDPGSQTVQVLGRDGEPLVAGPAQLAVPEARARDPYATIHKVISQDDVGDRAVAVCSITPGLGNPIGQSGVFPLLLSRLRR